MARLSRFTFVVNDEERRLIQVLADKLSRSQSDALRFMIVSATRELANDEQPARRTNRSEKVGQND